MPDPILYLNGPQAATFMGCTNATLQNKLKGPFPPPRTASKKYPSDQLGEWVRGEAVRAMHAKLEKDPNKLDGQHELARKNKELADKTMLENEVRREELIEVALVEMAWTDILARVKTRMLKIPSTLSTLLVGEEDQVVIQERIDETVRDALAEMSADWRENGSE